MSTKDKLIERFQSLPSDFTFDELKSVLGYYGFTIMNAGTTSGSRVRFKRGYFALVLSVYRNAYLVFFVTVVYVYFTLFTIWKNQHELS